PGNSGNSSGNNNSDDDSSPGNSGNSSGNGNNDSDADSGSGNSDNSNGNGNNEPEGDDADPGPGNSGSSSGNGNNDSDADSGPGNSGSSNGNGNNDSEDNNLISGNPDLTVDECLASPFCVLEEDTSKGKGNNTDNGNGNGNNSSKLTQSGENLIRNLITSSSALINDSIDRVVSGSVDDNTVLITSISTDAEGGIDSSASVGDLTINWGYWSLPGLLSQDQEFSRQEFQRVYLAVVDPADMDALKSTSANWSYNSVADQFTGSGSAGTMTDLNVGFDVDLNSGAIRNGSFSAEVDYGEELWSMNFTGNVNGAVASMNNFSDSVVITPAGISQGIQGELGGVFTGTGNTNAFVTGFSLNNGSNAVLGGFGLLEGSAP
ncbi:MAG: hypothetical protein HOH14_11275, partial [Gammaproteobacteria bacterium]|nr:hypothetical protein [Gammaproteobacteria bacterium]